MQAKTESVDLQDQTSLEMQQIKVQNEEPELSCPMSTISPV